MRVVCRPPRRARPWAHRVAALALCAAALGIPARLAPAEPAETPSPDARVPMVTLDALPLGIPLMSLDEDARDRVETLLGSSIFAQRISGIRFRSRETVFRFLLDHPDFATDVARALRLGAYRVTRLADGYWGDDDRGARGTIRVLYADEGRRLFHLTGLYDRPRVPTLRGQLLVLLEFRHEPDGDDATLADTALTGHLAVDTPLVGGLAQVIALVARPALERAAETKVRRFFRTVARVSRWAHDQPEELAAALEGHPLVPQDETLAAFRQILLAGRPPAWVSEPYRLLPTDAPDASP